MANTGDGTAWDVDDPTNSELILRFPLQVRDLRRGVGIRMNKEHHDLATSSGGGHHRKGSAVAFYQGSAPTARSNSDAFSGDDSGRLWVKSGTNRTLAVYDHSVAGFVDVVVGTNQIVDEAVTSAKIEAASLESIRRKSSVGVWHQESANVDGGTFTSGSWQTRTLNQKDADPDSLITLSSNQIVIGVGTYYFYASAVAYNCGSHQCKLRQVSGTPTDLLLGSVVYSGDSAVSSLAIGTIAIASSTTIELQHRCSNTRNSDGFGKACSWGVNYYAQVNIVELS